MEQTVNMINRFIYGGFNDFVMIQRVICCFLKTLSFSQCVTYGLMHSFTAVFLEGDFVQTCLVDI